MNYTHAKIQYSDNNRQNIRDTLKHIYQPDDCIVEDASDEEDEDNNFTASSYPDFTPIETFPTIDTA